MDKTRLVPAKGYWPTDIGLQITSYLSNYIYVSIYIYVPSGLYWDGVNRLKFRKKVGLVMTNRSNILVCLSRSTILFITVLEKIFRTWGKGDKGIQMVEPKERAINFKRLAFADYTAIVTNNRKKPRKL